MSGELPNGWAWAEFKDVADIALDLIDPTPLPDIWHLAPNHIETKTGKLIERSTIGADKVFSPKHRFHAGQIVYSKIRPYLAKAHYAQDSGLCSADMYPITPKINGRYLFRWMLTPAFTFAASGEQGRTVLPKINKEALARLPVPVPPEPEQRRIVTKIDSLFTRSSRARDKLAHIPKLIERYRQAVLEALYREAVEEATDRVTLDQVAIAVRNGLSRKPENAPPGVRILRISAVRVGRVVVDDHRYYRPSECEDISNYHLKVGDVLFVRFNGNAHFVGVCGVFRGGKDDVFVYPDKLIRVRLNEDVVTPEFVEGIFATPQVRYVMHQSIKTAAGQHGISGGDLKAIPFPLPPIAAQQRLIAKLQSQLAVIDQIAQELTQAATMIDRLDQSILDKAFTGKLVPQDPNDEPASKLLERIQAARAAAPKAKRGRRQAAP